MLIRFDGSKANLGNLYKNQSIFFIGSGPSLLKQDLSFLSARGILSFSVNNAPVGLDFSPTFWCCMDDPKSFHANIWNDATICKFCCNTYRKTGYFIDDQTRITNKIYDLSNIYFFLKRYGFDHKIFFTEENVCCGNFKGVKDSIGQKGCRSVMLVALKLIYYLGFNKIFLLGCDFNMEHDPTKDGKGLTYAFSQYKHAGGVLTNNYAYKILDTRFKSLLPFLKEKKVDILNCTPESNLTAFPYLPLTDAIEQATKKFQINPKTSGYYGGRENSNRFGW